MPLAIGCEVDFAVSLSLDAFCGGADPPFFSSHPPPAQTTDVFDRSLGRHVSLTHSFNITLHYVVERFSF